MPSLTKSTRKTPFYKKIFPQTALLLLGGITGFSAPAFAEAQKSIDSEARTMESAFSPGQACTQLLTRTIREAKKDIYVAVFSFTSRPIADALLNAAKRNVNVYIIVDRRNYKSNKAPQIDYLRNKVTSIHIDMRSKLFHHKYIIVDKKTVATGSFNFDANAEKNRENVLTVRNDEKLAKDFLDNWYKNLEKSQRLEDYGHKS